MAIMTNLSFGKGWPRITAAQRTSGYNYLKVNKEFPVGGETIISQLLSSPSSGSYLFVDGDLYIPNTKEFRIIEEGLGEYCEWDKIRVPIGEEEYVGYIHNGVIGKNSLPFKCNASSHSSLENILAKDWTKQEPNKVYHDQNISKWCIPFETEHESTGGPDLSERMKAVRQPAIDIILSELGKATTPYILRYDYIVRAEDWYLDPRPNTKLRVLVTIEDKYISAMEDIDLTYEKADRVISLNSSEYKNKVEQAVGIMRDYADDIASFEGTVENLDLLREANRLETIPSKLSRLLHSNNVQFGDDTIIEIGLNQIGTCKYVAENSRGIYKNLTNGVNSFIDSEPFDSERTMHYLYMLDEIIVAAENDTSWSSFISGFTISPEVGIFPSLPSGSSPLDISATTRSQTESSIESSTAAKLDKESKDIFRVLGMSGGKSGGACAKDSYQLDLWSKKTRNKIIEDLDKGKEYYNNMDLSEAVLGTGEGSLFKTVADAAKEEAEFGKKAVVDKIKMEAEKAVDDILDKTLGDLNSIIAKVDSIDDVFEEVLNKICMADLAIPALACLEIPSLSPEFKEILDELPDIDLCKADGRVCIPTVSLPAFETTDLMRQMSRAILNAILDVLTKVFVEMVKAIVESLLSICAEEDDENAIQPTDIPKMPNVFKDLPGTAGVDLPALVSDVADILSPNEFCRLLNGDASPKTLSLIRSLIKNRYPSLFSKLKTKTSITDLFFGLGSMVDSRMCEQMANLPEEPASLNCGSTYAMDPDLVAKLASDEELTDEQLEEQLTKARERKKAKYEKFAEIVKVITGDSGKSFQDIVMDMVYNSDNSVININSGSIDYMHEQLLRTMFGGLKKSFDDGTQSLLDSFSETTFEKVLKPLETVISDPPSIVLSMDANKLISQGISEEYLREFAKENDGKIEVNREIRKTNKRIRSLLGNIETNEVFTEGYDHVGIYYELIIPNDPERIATI